MKKRKIILLVIALVLFYFIPSSLAIFKEIKIGNGRVTSASWSVSLNQEGITNNLSVMPNSKVDSYTVNVRSNSEVDVSYTIIVSNLPTGIEISLDNGSYVTPTNNTITFTNAGVINHNSATKTRSHTLTFKANSNATTVSNRQVNIDVKFQQVVS